MATSNERALLQAQETINDIAMMLAEIEADASEDLARTFVATREARRRVERLAMQIGLGPLPDYRPERRLRRAVAS